MEKSTTKDVLLGSYAIHVAICEYVAPDDLYDQLMGITSESEVVIPTISLKPATEIAKKFLADQTVSILDSDDEDNVDKTAQGKKVDAGKSLTFSLLCSMSKTVMQTPVRGRHCAHMQCFDLRNFLHTNKNITGGRWRCAVSQQIVFVRFFRNLEPTFLPFYY